MKIISIGIAEFNEAGVCVGCMNLNRKMHYSKRIKECFKLIADIEIPDGLAIRVCWECMACINNISKFKNIIESSYQLLYDYYKESKSIEELAVVCADVPQKLQPVNLDYIAVPFDYEVLPDNKQIKEEEDSSHSFVSDLGI